MYLLKIIMITPLKKIIEVFQLITKIFLGSDSEKSLKYTFKKNSLKLLVVLNASWGVCFENNHEYTLHKKFIEAFRLITKILLGANSNRSMILLRKSSQKPFGCSEPFSMCIF